MKNYNKSDENINLIAPAGGVVGGDIHVEGQFAGVVHGSVAEGYTFVLELEGIYTVAKKTTDVVAIGDLLYFDTGLEAVTTSADDGGSPATAFVFVGKAVEVADGTTTTVAVRLGY